MNLFRSEEHVQNWSGFQAGTEEAILSVFDIMAILSTPRHSEKLNGHYTSTCADYVNEFIENVKKVTKNVAFWKPD